METSTKSLPASLQQLVRSSGFFPRKAEFRVTSDAFVVLNTSGFGRGDIFSTAMRTINPDSRGYYQGDDGESQSETLTEFHGPVCVRVGRRVVVEVPGRTGTAAKVLSDMHAEEGSTMVQEPTTKPPKSANPAVLVALDTFVPFVDAMVQKATSKRSHIEIEYGKKYVKLVQAGGQRSVHCFVDLATGDVLKAASWAAPAKHARGNILGDAAKYGVSWTGANYIR